MLSPSRGRSRISLQSMFEVLSFFKDVTADESVGSMQWKTSSANRTFNEIIIFGLGVVTEAAAAAAVAAAPGRR